LIIFDFIIIIIIFWGFIWQKTYRLPGEKKKKKKSVLSKGFFWGVKFHIFST